MAPATSVTSTGVTATSTYYPFFLKGTFRNTANCSIQFQFASENNGNTTTIGS